MSEISISEQHASRKQSLEADLTAARNSLDMPDESLAAIEKEVAELSAEIKGHEEAATRARAEKEELQPPLHEVEENTRLEEQGLIEVGVGCCFWDGFCLFVCWFLF